MEIAESSVAQLKRYIEMNNGDVFWGLLNRRKNHHFFQDKVTKAKNGYFDPDGKTLIWNDQYVCTALKNEDNVEYNEVIIDLQISGILNEFNNRGRTFSSNPVTFNFTIQAFIFKDFGTSIEHINLLNSEQKSLLLFHKSYELELERIGVKLIPEYIFEGKGAVVFFTKIRKCVNSENTKMVNVTGLDYFDELTECHRNIRYSVACANVWGRYATHYTDHTSDFQGRTIYQVALGFYDYRYLSYVENAVNELYTFYERLGYLMYSFLEPSFDVNLLSFSKLFQSDIKKELKAKYPNLIDNPHFDWFSKRITKEHRKLSEYRHPLVHYQSSNTFIKGSYIASFRRHLLNSASGSEEELSRLLKGVNDISKFINHELIVCKEAFERTILLIEGHKDLPSDVNSAH